MVSNCLPAVSVLFSASNEEQFEQFPIDIDRPEGNSVFQLINRHSIGSEENANYFRRQSNPRDSSDCRRHNRNETASVLFNAKSGADTSRRREAFAAN